MLSSVRERESEAGSPQISANSFSCMSSGSLLDINDLYVEGRSRDRFIRVL